MAGGLIQVWAEADSASIKAATRGIEAAISDASLEVWLSAEAGPYLAAQTQVRFANEGDPTVGQWAQLAPATVGIRESKGFPGAHPINKRTGALEAYLIQAAGRIEPTATGVQLVTPEDSPDAELSLKLATAQSGGTSKWGNPVPKRPVLGIGLEDGLALTKLLEAHIEAQIVTGGGIL